MNIGERDELITIMNLIKLRDSNSYFDGYVINSISTNGNECKKLPINYDINNLISLSDCELLSETSKYGVIKSSSKSKADVYINNVGYSLKSIRGGRPAIVNHTARPGFERVMNSIGLDISKLDEVINSYWSLRISNVIGEDVKNSNPNSPFYNHINLFKPLLNYFIFNGTGSSDSKFPASKLISIKNPLLIDTWKVYDETNLIDLYWDKLVFSLRSKKGMPKGYPNKLSLSGKLKKPSIDKWVKFINGNYGGALHIRVS